MLRRLLPALIALTVAAPASAQSITLEADLVLWCGSAFYWLSSDASDAGSDDEADRYLGWSEQLMARGVELLRADKHEDDEIERIVSVYDRSVLAELGTPRARHDITKCPGLVEPEK